MHFHGTTWTTFRRAFLRAFSFLVILVAAQPGKAQDGAVSTASAPIVIVIKGRSYPVEVDAKTSAVIGTFSRQADAEARFFSRCVKPQDNASLRELIDAPAFRGVRESALNRIVFNHLACYPGASVSSAHNFGGCNPRRTLPGFPEICQAFFDRGALLEKVLTTYAPDLSFTTAELLAPNVLSRFHAREARLDQGRSKPERIFAQVVGCLVATHPELALDFPKTTPGSQDEANLRAAMIGSAPECVGGAKHVTVDAIQFRFLLDDAIYSWGAAVRGADTLIPLSTKDG